MNVLKHSSEISASGFNSKVNVDSAFQEAAGFGFEVMDWSLKGLYNLFSN